MENLLKQIFAHCIFYNIIRTFSSSWKLLLSLRKVLVKLPGFVSDRNLGLMLVNEHFLKVVFCVYLANKNVLTKKNIVLHLLLII